MAIILIFMFDADFIFTSPDEVTGALAARLKKRRLEKGLTRDDLQSMTGVPKSTVARFETTSKISLESFVRIAMALGCTDEMEKLFMEARYSTMEELETIKRNANRQRGTRK